MSDIERLGIGELISGNQQKDAIHVAITPVITGKLMKPGTHVRVKDGVAFPAEKDAIGIIDPFLKTQNIGKDSRVWLFLYPGSVISLRHDWTHLAFISEETKKASEEWLINFCDTHDCPSYETVMAAIRGEVHEIEYYGRSSEYNDEYLHFNGSDAHSSIPDEFWTHVEIVLGRKPDYRPKYFSCSC